MSGEQSQSKIKIAFFDEAVAFGGSVVVLSHLFEHLDRSKFEPRLVSSLDASALRQLFNPRDILCWFRPILHYASRVRWMAHCPWSTGPGRRLWAYGFTAAAFIANLPANLALLLRVAMWFPDIIHVNNGREGLFIAKLFRIPLVWHLHGIADDLVGNTYGARDATAIFVSISKYISEEAMRSGVARERIIDIPNPAPIDAPLVTRREDWLERFSIPANAIVLAHVGRLLRWKGQLEFLQAFAKIASMCPEAIVLIVGDDVEGFTADYPAALHQLVADRDLQQRVIFTGHIPNILELMAAVDIVVHSSIEPEPFGLVITEAMSVGAAVIAARLGAPIEIIEDGVTGLLVDPTNIDEFSTALVSLLIDPDRRKSIAAAGQSMVRDRYSPALFARCMGDAYQQVIISARAD